MRGSMRSTGGGGSDQVQQKRLKRNTFASRPLEMEVDDTASTSERQQLTPQTEPKSRPDALAYASTAFIFLSVAVFIWLSFRSGVTLFSFHPTLMAVGFILFMTSALNAFSPADITVLLCPNPSYKQRVQRHWILQVCGLLCIIAGFIVIVINKIKANKYHFTSIHGVFGLIAFILVILSSFGGLMTLYSSKLKRILTPVYIKLLHTGFGITSYIAGVLNMIIILYSGWLKDDSFEKYFLNAILFFLVVFVSLRPCVRFYIRLKEKLGYGSVA